jgi:hypothetical protein
MSHYGASKDERAPIYARLTLDLKLTAVQGGIGHQVCLRRSCSLENRYCMIILRIVYLMLVLSPPYKVTSIHPLQRDRNDLFLHAHLLATHIALSARYPSSSSSIHDGCHSGPAVTPHSSQPTYM